MTSNTGVLDSVVAQFGAMALATVAILLAWLKLP